MKKMIAILLIVMIALLMVVGLTACGEDKAEETKPAETTPIEDGGDEAGGSTDGGWTAADSIVVPDEVKVLFDQANETLTGAQLEPIVYLGSQVVAGTNHLVLCKQTATVPDAATFYVIATLYEDLQGNAEITDIQESTASAPAPYDPDNPMSGAYGEPTSYEVPDEASAALQKACAELDGASYEPIALLGTQIVAGTNYQLLCKVTPVVPNAESHYSVVTVYADLEGGAEITETIDFGAADEDAEEAIDEEFAKDSASSQAD